MEFEGPTAEERERRRKEAVWHCTISGAKNAAVTAVVLGAAHVALTSLHPGYRSVNVYAKRILPAIIVVGSYAFTAQLESGRFAQRYAALDAEAMEVSDAARAVAMADRAQRVSASKANGKELK